MQTTLAQQMAAVKLEATKAKFRTVSGLKKDIDHYNALNDAYSTLAMVKLSSTGTKKNKQTNKDED